MANDNTKPTAMAAIATKPAGLALFWTGSSYLFIYSVDAFTTRKTNVVFAATHASFQ